MNEQGEQWVILKQDGERVVMRGVKTEEAARRVFYGPWRRTGDKLVKEQTVATWEWSDD